MYLSKQNIEDCERKKRLNIINSISGIKSANLIGTKSNDGQENLAIFNSFVHIGSNPALIGFILRPTGEVPRHTFKNIQENSYYTINHIPTSIIEKAHYTSAKIEENEFDRCKLTAEYLYDFHAPFVKESPIKIGVKLEEVVPIQINNTSLVIGSIEHLYIDDQGIDERGYIDLGKLNIAGISGLNSYYELNKINEFPYARPNQIPNFND